MLISHKYKFIFVKTRKTAGSSIEVYLLDYLKGSDYVFTGFPEHNLPAHNLPLDNKHGHSGWQWIKKNYPYEWENYFTFAVDRNPWDRFVSLYYWEMEQHVQKGLDIAAFPSFERFVRKPKRWKKSVEWPMYADGDNIVVDWLVKYEDLHETFQEMPLPYNGELQSVFMKKYNRRPSDYRSMYTLDTAELVRRSASNIIKHFNYEF
mgnify:CR=1 FL=1